VTAALLAAPQRRNEEAVFGQLATLLAALLDALSAPSEKVVLQALAVLGDIAGHSQYFRRVLMSLLDRCGGVRGEGVKGCLLWQCWCSSDADGVQLLHACGSFFAPLCRGPAAVAGPHVQLRTAAKTFAGSQSNSEAVPHPPPAGSVATRAWCCSRRAARW
jgi:hypothetical protein